VSRRWYGIRPVWWGALVALAVGLALAVLYGAQLAALWQQYVPASLESTVRWLRESGPLAPAASMVLMVLQSVFSPLPGSLVAAANGALFGVWWGSLLSWAGGMAGALVTYAIGRWLGERAVARWGANPRWQRLAELGEKDGFWIVLVARLTPIISLDFIGYLAGAASMPLRPYLLANAIGLLPGMVAYTILGHDLASARGVSWQLGTACLVLVVLFFLGRRFLRGGLERQNS
jgi:uncharacterized membrane protein YdjX (TVP38/TMEM64 family)